MPEKEVGVSELWSLGVPRQVLSCFAYSPPGDPAGQPCHLSWTDREAEAQSGQVT